MENINIKNWSVGEVYGVEGSDKIVVIEDDDRSLRLYSIIDGRSLWEVNFPKYSVIWSVSSVGDYYLVEVRGEPDKVILIHRTSGKIIEAEEGFELACEAYTHENLRFSISREGSVDNFQVLSADTGAVRSFSMAKLEMATIRRFGDVFIGSNVFQQRQILYGKIDDKSNLPDESSIVEIEVPKGARLGLEVVLDESKASALVKMPAEEASTYSALHIDLKTRSYREVPFRDSKTALYTCGFRRFSDPDGDRICIMFNGKNTDLLVWCFDVETGEKLWESAINSINHAFCGNYLVTAIGEPSESVIGDRPELKYSSWKMDLRTGEVSRLTEEKVAHWISVAGDGVVFGLADEGRGNVTYMAIE